jgi:hypothetical protein
MLYASEPCMMTSPDCCRRPQHFATATLHEVPGAKMQSSPLKHMSAAAKSNTHLEDTLDRVPKHECEGQSSG